MSKKRITRTEYFLTLADGKEYAVRPLSLAKMKEITPLIRQVESLPDEANVEEFPEVVSKLVDVCFIILNASNNGITKERVEEIVTMEDIQAIVSIGASGQVPKGSETEEI